MSINLKKYIVKLNKLDKLKKLHKLKKIEYCQ